MIKWQRNKNFHYDWAFHCFTWFDANFKQCYIKPDVIIEYWNKSVSVELDHIYKHKFAVIINKDISFNLQIRFLVIFLRLCKFSMMFESVFFCTTQTCILGNLQICLLYDTKLLFDQYIYMKLLLGLHKYWSIHRLYEGEDF